MIFAQVEKHFKKKTTCNSLCEVYSHNRKSCNFCRKILFKKEECISLTYIQLPQHTLYLQNFSADTLQIQIKGKGWCQDCLNVPFWA